MVSVKQAVGVSATPLVGPQRPVMLGRTIPRTMEGGDSVANLCAYFRDIPPQRPRSAF